MFQKPELLQQKIYQEIKKHKDVIPCRASFLSEIVSVPEEVIEKIFGETGIELKKFANEIDFDHPHICDVMNGIFAISDEFSDTFIQLLELGKLACEKKYDLAVAHFPKIFRRLCLDKKMVKSPNLAKQFVRLLKDADSRNKFREQKKIETIELSFAKSELLWHGLPTDFTMYARYSDAYIGILSEAKQKAEKYKSLGCEILYDEIQKSISEFEDSFVYSYHGFHRLKMTEAAIILAKFHGFVLEKITEKSFITIKNFQFNCFDLPDHRQRRAEAFVYQPHAIPLGHMTWLPDSVVDIIQHLEHFPEINNKPVFDHFVFVCPKVNGMAKKVKELVEEGIFMPILLGEKDGKCYFICHVF